LKFGRVGKLQKNGFRGNGHGYWVLAITLKEAVGVGVLMAKV
jgi:hypothetical protein